MGKLNKTADLLACLSILFLAGTVVGFLLLGTQYNDGNFNNRLNTMHPTQDFEIIPGGCTIRSSVWTVHSYSYSQRNCYSQCYQASACSERWTYNITVPGSNNISQSAPQDYLLSTWQSCSKISIPKEPTMDPAFAVNTTKVPCWRARYPLTITRNERLPNDPRTSSYDGLTSCRSRCSLVVGYACGNEDCVVIKDPAEQYTFYEQYDSPTMASNVGIVVGCSVGTILSCIAGYWTNKEANKSVEVEPASGSSGEEA